MLFISFKKNISKLLKVFEKAHLLDKIVESMTELDYTMPK